MTFDKTRMEQKKEVEGKRLVGAVVNGVVTN